MLLEEEVVVRCRQADEPTVHSVLSSAVEQYSNTIELQTGAKRSCRLTVDGSKHLSADLLGGIVLCCQEGTITVDNTVDSRLGLVMEQDKPAIRAMLFPHK